MPSYTETFACDVCCGTTTTTVGPSTTVPPGSCFGACTWYCNGETLGVYYWELVAGCNTHPENVSLECSCDSPEVVFNMPCNAGKAGDVDYTNCTGATTTTQSPATTTCAPGQTIGFRLQEVFNEFSSVCKICVAVQCGSSEPNIFYTCEECESQANVFNSAQPFCNLYECSPSPPL